MEFVISYLGLLSHAPIFVVVATIVVTLLTTHIVTPIVCELWVGLWEYWSRGTSKVTNAYATWLNKSHMQYIVRRTDDKYIFDFSDSGWVGGAYSGSYVSKARAVSKASQRDVYYIEACPTAVDSGETWLKTMGKLLGYGVITVVTSLALQVAIIKAPIIIVVALVVIGGIFVVLKGGRAVCDLSKKVDSLSAVEAQ